MDSTYRKIVIKVGSNVLSQPDGAPDLDQMKNLVHQIAEVVRQGIQVILVSSGAVAFGRSSGTMKNVKDEIARRQVWASLGQVKMIREYQKYFEEEHMLCSQVLVTRDDFRSRRHYLNMRQCLSHLTSQGIIPVINENDVVSVNEIKVGDNDVLAALSAIMIDADLLILLSTTNGFRKTLENGRSRIVPYLPGVDQEAMRHVNGKGSDLSTGGMETKLKAAQKAVDVGIATVIADGRRPGIIQHILEGRRSGTLIAAPDWALNERALTARKRWIAYFNRAAGSITVDDGAKKAILEDGRSLLPIGIRQVTGSFSMGDIVNIRDLSGHIIAAGLTDYAAEDVARIMGKKTREIREIMKTCEYDEVIHRDNLVVLK